VRDSEQAVWNAVDTAKRRGAWDDQKSAKREGVPRFPRAKTTDFGSKKRPQNDQKSERKKRDKKKRQKMAKKGEKSDQKTPFLGVFGPHFHQKRRFLTPFLTTFSTTFFEVPTRRKKRPENRAKTDPFFTYPDEGQREIDFDPETTKKRV
jgi:hypothetical protein